MSDVVVVGAGFAGLFTANMLSSKGLNVKLLYKGLGATILSSGRFCILDTKARSDKKSLEKKFMELGELHPYKVLSKGSFTEFISLLRESVKEMRTYLGRTFRGDFRKSEYVIYQSGSILETTLILNTMDGALLKDSSERILLLGVEGLYEFNPSLVKGVMERNLESIGLEEIEIETDVITRNELKISSSSTLAEGYIDEDSLAKSILRRYRKCGCKILFPPILSYKYIRELYEESSGKISEFPAEPKFAVGKRVIEKFIEEALKNGVELKHVNELIVRPDKSEKIYVEYSSLNKSEKLETEFLVIATGDLIGGGIKARRKGNIVEYIDTALGRKIALMKIDINKSNYLSSSTTKIFNVGYPINERSQPVDEENEVIHERIFVAGSAIGGKSFEGEGTGLGLPLISAYKSVKEILSEW